MWPTLRDGDYAVARKDRAGPGAVAIFRHPALGLILKRVIGRDDRGRYRVAGDNPDASHGRAYGWLAPSAVLAVVRWRISPEGVTRVR